MPAALLVLVAALAGVFGVPGAVASDGPAAARSVVRDPAAQRLVVPGRSTAAARTGSTVAVHATADRSVALRSGPAPGAVVPTAALLLGLAVLGVVVGAGDGWSLPRRTPRAHRGRAPPAYAPALA